MRATRVNDNDFRPVSDTLQAMTAFYDDCFTNVDY